MSQKFALYDDLTVLGKPDFLRRGVRHSRQSRASQERLELVGLTGHESDADPVRCPPAGGSAWRWASPWSTTRSLLFLDEPTCGVDPIARRAFWDLIYDLAGQGVTILVTTHYMDEAEYCDRVGIMRAANCWRWIRPANLKESLGQRSGR